MTPWRFLKTNNWGMRVCSDTYTHTHTHRCTHTHRQTKRCSLGNIADTHEHAHGVTSCVCYVCVQLRSVYALVHETTRQPDMLVLCTLLSLTWLTHSCNYAMV